MTSTLIILNFMAPDFRTSGKNDSDSTLKRADLGDFNSIYLK